MKKTAAIFLLLLMLFNAVGYRFVFSYLDTIATENLDASIDAGDYAEEGLIEISVPLNMPYQERYTEFERKYGEITLEGKVYAYVKMKIEGDKMILKCIANYEKQELKNDFANLVKANGSQDMENTGKKHTLSFSKIFSTDYEDRNQYWFFNVSQMMSSQVWQNYTASLTNVLIKTPHQPPRC